MGNKGWSYAEVLPFFKRMERYNGDGHATYRGSEGPLRVRLSSRSSAGPRILHDTTHIEPGWPVIQKKDVHAHKLFTFASISGQTLCHGSVT
jgi:choline dehydrogenase-like flavoprotein